MNRRLIYVCLCITLLSSFSCSKEGDEIKSLSAQVFPYYGYYKGVWQLNGKIVDADEISVNNMVYVSVKNDEVTPVPFTFVFFDGPGDLSSRNNFLQMAEFPICEMVRHIFPDIEIACIFCGGHEIPTYNEEGKKLLDSFELADNVGLSHFMSDTMGLDFVGFSEDMYYYVLKSKEGAAYLRTPIVITTNDGDYFVMVFDFLPSQSTVSYDTSSKTLSFVLCMKQIEIFDKDGNKTIKSLDSEMIITFISTQKIY